MFSSLTMTFILTSIPIQSANFGSEDRNINISIVEAFPYGQVYSFINSLPTKTDGQEINGHYEVIMLIKLCIKRKL